MHPIEATLDGPVWQVAPRLLGWTLRTAIGGLETSVRIEEVEAYDQTDPASHSYRGPTPRCASMFLGAGHVYVYRSYGIHWCVNLVAGAAGHGSGILIRGGVPTEGIEIMKRRRGRTDHLANGPGKLCQALGITGDLNGLRITSDSPLQAEPPQAPLEYTATPRIGITRATEKPWRFLARGGF